MLASDAVYAVKLRTSLPSSQDLFQDSDLMLLIDQELRSDIYPWITKQREEHFLSSKTISVVAGTSYYRIPARAYANKLRDVQKVDGVNISSLVRFWEEDRGRENTDGFFITANQVELSPAPIANSTIKLVYHRKPSTLVAIANTAKIGAINTALSQVTVETLPSGISTGSLVDIVSQTSPFFAEDDITVVGISGLVITLSSIPAQM